MTDFRKLKEWNKAHELTVDVYWLHNWEKRARCELKTTIQMGEQV
ncbi:hypothetical protein [Coleofasciculus chthonoplastes]